MPSPDPSFLSGQINLLNSVLAASTDHIYIIDRAGRYHYASPAGLAALGLQAEDMVGKTWQELNFPAAVMERHDAQRESVFQTGTAVQGETSFPTVDGVRHYEYVLSPVLGQAGAIEAVISTVRDITERQQTEAALQAMTTVLEARVQARTQELATINQSLRAEIAERQKVEQALREQEERTRLATEAADLGMWFWDLNRNELVWTDRCKAIFGLAPDDSISYEAFLNTLHPEDRDRTHAAVTQALEQRVDYDIEYRTLWPDGSIHWIAAKGRGFYDTEGQPIRMMGAAQDISRLKQAECTLLTARNELERKVKERTRELQAANDLLEQRERQFRTLVENTPDVITRHDRQYRCLYINPASTHSLGLPPDFFLGKTPSELGYPDDLANFWHTSLESVFVTGQMRVDEFTVMGENGPLTYQVYVVPEKEADQTITSVLTIGRDVTQLRHSEASARQLAEELQRSNQELEQFAYVASHDLQEPLRAITSFTQLLAKRYQGQIDAKANTYIEFIVDGATRMQHLIRDLLTYSRAGRYDLKQQPIDSNALLERVKKDLQVIIAETKATITADDLPSVMADPTQLGNVLQNLLSNSLKYRSETPPQIHISARKGGVQSIHNADPNSAGLKGADAPKAWVFSIRDNGIGIDPQYNERIFGIFQRLHTHEEYSGTGLGLAICRKIIERHGGRIWVESQPGQGSTFSFTLPISVRPDHDSYSPTPQHPSG